MKFTALIFSVLSFLLMLPQALMAQSAVPTGLTDRGKSRIKFLEKLVVRFNSDQEGTITEDEEDEVIKEENGSTRTLRLCWTI